MILNRRIMRLFSWVRLCWRWSWVLVSYYWVCVKKLIKQSDSPKKSPRPWWQHVIRGCILGIILVGLSVMSLPWWLSSDWFRQQIQDDLQQQLHMPVSVGTVHVSWADGITIDGLSVQAPAGFQTPEICHIEKVRCDFSPFHFLLHQKLKWLELDRPYFTVELDEKGNLNLAALRQASAGSVPAEQISIRQAEVSLHAENNPRLLVVNISDLQFQDGKMDQLGRVSLSARLNQTNGAAPLSLHLQGRSGASSSQTSTDLAFDFMNLDLAQLPISLLSDKPFRSLGGRCEGRLVLRVRKNLDIETFRLELLVNDLAVVARHGEKLPRIKQAGVQLSARLDAQTQRADISELSLRLPGVDLSGKAVIDPELFFGQWKGLKQLTLAGRVNLHQLTTLIAPDAWPKPLTIKGDLAVDVVAMLDEEELEWNLLANAEKTLIAWDKLILKHPAQPLSLQLQADWAGQNKPLELEHGKLQWGKNVFTAAGVIAPPTAGSRAPSMAWADVVKQADRFQLRGTVQFRDLSFLKRWGIMANDTPVVYKGLLDGSWALGGADRPRFSLSVESSSDTTLQLGQAFHKTASQPFSMDFGANLIPAMPYFDDLLLDVMLAGGRVSLAGRRSSITAASATKQSALDWQGDLQVSRIEHLLACWPQYKHAADTIQGNADLRFSLRLPDQWQRLNPKYKSTAGKAIALPWRIECNATDATLFVSDLWNKPQADKTRLTLQGSHWPSLLDISQPLPGQVTPRITAVLDSAWGQLQGELHWPRRMSDSPSQIDLTARITSLQKLQRQLPAIADQKNTRLKGQAELQVNWKETAKQWNFNAFASTKGCSGQLGQGDRQVAWNNLPLQASLRLAGQRNPSVILLPIFDARLAAGNSQLLWTGKIAYRPEAIKQGQTPGEALQAWLGKVARQLKSSKAPADEIASVLDQTRRHCAGEFNWTTRADIDQLSRWIPKLKTFAASRGLKGKGLLRGQVRIKDGLSGRFHIDATTLAWTDWQKTRKLAARPLHATAAFNWPRQNQLRTSLHGKWNNTTIAVSADGTAVLPTNKQPGRVDWNSSNGTFQSTDLRQWASHYTSLKRYKPSGAMQLDLQWQAKRGGSGSLRFKDCRAEIKGKPVLLAGTLAIKGLNLNGGTTFRSIDQLETDDFVLHVGKNRGWMIVDIRDVPNRPTGKIHLLLDRFNDKELIDWLTLDQPAMKPAGKLTKRETAKLNQQVNTWLDRLKTYSRNARLTARVSANQFSTYDPKVKQQYDVSKLALQAKLNRGLFSLQYDAALYGGLIQAKMTTHLQAKRPIWRSKVKYTDVEATKQIQPQIAADFPGNTVQGTFSRTEEVQHSLADLIANSIDSRHEIIRVGEAKMVATKGFMVGKGAPAFVRRIFPGLKLTKYEYDRMTTFTKFLPNGSQENETLFNGQYHLYMEGTTSRDRVINYTVGLVLLPKAVTPEWQRDWKQGRMPILKVKGRIEKGKLVDDTVSYPWPNETLGEIFIRNNLIYRAWLNIKNGQTKTIEPQK